MVWHVKQTLFSCIKFSRVNQYSLCLLTSNGNLEIGPNLSLNIELLAVYTTFRAGGLSTILGISMWTSRKQLVLGSLLFLGTATFLMITGDLRMIGARDETKNHVRAQHHDHGCYSISNLFVKHAQSLRRLEGARLLETTTGCSDHRQQEMRYDLAQRLPGIPPANCRR